MPIFAHLIFHFGITCLCVILVARSFSAFQSSISENVKKMPKDRFHKELRFLALHSVRQNAPFEPSKPTIGHHPKGGKNVWFALK